MANFAITVDSYTNLPPTQVGDGAESTNHSEDIVFTGAMFTTNTTPAYADPEGDAALNLKITSLPASGTLKFSGVAVLLNAIISFADIALSKFTYTPDPSNLNAHATDFTFEIADAGSGTFVG